MTKRTPLRPKVVLAGLLSLAFLAFLAMGFYSYSMWLIVDSMTIDREILGHGNWVLSENLHFYNRNNNIINVYSKNQRAKSVLVGSMHVNVVPLLLEPGRHSQSGDMFINANDFMLLRYACFLSATGDDHEVINLLLTLLPKNNSLVSEHYSHVISACISHLNGDRTYEEDVLYYAEEYSYYKKLYSAHLRSAASGGE